MLRAGHLLITSQTYRKYSMIAQLYKKILCIIAQLSFLLKEQVRLMHLESWRLVAVK